VEAQADSISAKMPAVSARRSVDFDMCGE